MLKLFRKSSHKLRSKNMEKIVILSDTHNNQKLFRQGLQNETGVKHVFHLGDNYEDLNDNFDLTENVIIHRVPGIFHPGYSDKTLPSSLDIDILGWKLILVHDIKDSVNKREGRDIIFYGHTHKATFYEKNNKYYLNPGHLKKEFDRGIKASYAVMEIDENKISIKFKYVDGIVFQENFISRKGQ